MFFYRKVITLCKHGKEKSKKKIKYKKKITIIPGKQIVLSSLLWIKHPDEGLTLARTNPNIQGQKDLSQIMCFSM